MDRQQAEKRVRELRDILWENSRRYYVDSAPVMSDYDYDALMRELGDLESMYPDLVTPDSPTMKVGSDLESGPDLPGDRSGSEFARYPHKYPMLSLGNTYSISEIEDFAARVTRALGKEFSFCCELKFDGTAICLTYRHGVLFRALTRGDGAVGDDVTENVRRISGIPHKLSGSGYPDEFEIRGEILMPYKAFDKINAARAENEEPPFANPRNAASGSLKLTDPAEVGRRGLQCTLYHIPAQSVDFATHDQALRAAASWGLPVSDKRRICRDIGEIEEYIRHWDTARRDLPYATDGIVIKVNEIEFQKELGYTSKFPRWAVAFKFKAEQALAEVLSIDYQVGRTGAVTPVANLSPVHLSGTVVKRATLNNAGQMALMDIRIGDRVYVEKGGEIIPKIVGVEKKLRPSGAAVPHFPEVCPDCGTPLTKDGDEARWFCPNYYGCPTQIKGRILHFMSRKAMNVIAGEATVAQLYDRGLVKTPADLYELKKSDLLTLDGWKEKSADRFLESLGKTVDVPFTSVLFALGIRYVGETTAKTLAEHFGSIEKIMEASREDFLKVPDVGEVVAASLCDYFGTPGHIDEIRRLEARGLRFSMEKRQAASSALEGKTIVISGNFSISREDMKRMIEDNGGKNSSSLSGNTSFLLAGTKPGPEKMKKAAQLGIPVISEDDFRKMLPQGVRKEAPADIEEENLFGGLI